MSQSRAHSFLEACVNITIGFGVALGAQLVIFPWFGIHIPFEQDLAIGGLFTVVSLVRSYLIRRLFNWWHA